MESSAREVAPVAIALQPALWSLESKSITVAWIGFIDKMRYTVLSKLLRVETQV